MKIHYFLWSQYLNTLLKWSMILVCISIMYGKLFGTNLSTQKSQLKSSIQSEQLALQQTPFIHTCKDKVLIQKIKTDETQDSEEEKEALKRHVRRAERAADDARKAADDAKRSAVYTVPAPAPYYYPPYGYRRYYYPYYRHHHRGFFGFGW